MLSGCKAAFVNEPLQVNNSVAAGQQTMPTINAQPNLINVFELPVYRYALIVLTLIGTLVFNIVVVKIWIGSRLLSDGTRIKHPGGQ